MWREATVCDFVESPRLAFSQFPYSSSVLFKDDEQVNAELEPRLGCSSSRLDWWPGESYQRREVSDCSDDKEEVMIENDSRR